MENRYKIILSGNQIYKEAELPADMERVTVGTGIDCTVRLRRDLFFESIQIEFVKESGGWRATCSDNIYFKEGDIQIYDAESDPRRYFGSQVSGIRRTCI